MLLDFSEIPVELHPPAQAVSPLRESGSIKLRAASATRGSRPTCLPLRNSASRLDIARKFRGALSHSSLVTGSGAFEITVRIARKRSST